MWCMCTGDMDDEGSSSEEDTRRDKKKPKGEMCGLVSFNHLCLECNFLQSWNATSYKVWQIKRCDLLLMAYLDADDSHKPLCFLLLFFAVLVQMQQQRL